MIRIQCVLCPTKIEEIRVTADDLDEVHQAYVMHEGVAVIPSFCPQCSPKVCPNCGHQYAACHSPRDFWCGG